MTKHKSEQKHGAFQELVSGIRVAEEECDHLKEGYDAKVEELLKKGREKSLEMRESYEKKAAEAKNKALASERQKTEKAVEEIISDAKKRANGLRGKELDKKELEAVFETFISSL